MLQSTTVSIPLSVLMAIFQVNLVRRFYWSKYGGGVVENWRHKICKAPIKSSPTFQCPVFYRLDATEID